MLQHDFHLPAAVSGLKEAVTDSFRLLPSAIAVVAVVSGLYSILAWTLIYLDKAGGLN